MSLDPLQTSKPVGGTCWMVRYDHQHGLTDGFTGCSHTYRPQDFQAFCRQADDTTHVCVQGISVCDSGGDDIPPPPPMHAHGCLHAPLLLDLVQLTPGPARALLLPHPARSSEHHHDRPLLINGIATTGPAGITPPTADHASPLIHPPSLPFETADMVMKAPALCGISSITHSSGPSLTLARRTSHRRHRPTGPHPRAPPHRCHTARPGSRGLLKFQGRARKEHR